MQKHAKNGHKKVCKGKEAVLIHGEEESKLMAMMKCINPISASKAVSMPPIERIYGLSNAIANLVALGAVGSNADCIFNLFIDMNQYIFLMFLFIDKILFVRHAIPGAQSGEGQCRSIPHVVRAIHW